ncbi:hypothetical protein KP509_29G084600 [Ceratopteris richardii]|uniref:Uncharacterized protein n=1 Tax=Ceratopteris richardii TaxID=49495 RepID=A0A8T2R8T5_CERRI|nr:hypothetical protein KP509_29G084600 [Ceratopteris richardii]
MIADCHSVGIKEGSPKYDDNLAQRVDRMEREIKKLQETTGRYDYQAGKMAEEFHMKLERMESAQAESDEKMRQLEKENERLTGKLGEWMSERDDERRKCVEGDQKVGKMEEELKAILGKLDALGVGFEGTEKLAKKVDELEAKHESRIWEDRTIREEVEKLSDLVKRREEVPLKTESMMSHLEEERKKMWIRFHQVDDEIFRLQGSDERKEEEIRDLALKLEALRGVVMNGGLLDRIAWLEDNISKLSNHVEALRGRGWR